MSSLRRRSQSPPARPVRVTPLFLDVKVSDTWVEQLNTYFPDREIEISSKNLRSSHHPQARTLRAVSEDDLYRRATRERFNPNAKWVIDVGGNPNRHRRMQRNNVWSLNPILDRNDEFRRTTSRSKNSCNCTVQKFMKGGCDKCFNVGRSVRSFICVHSLYYLKPKVVMQMCKIAPTYSVHHRFPGNSGTILEASWHRANSGIIMDAGDNNTYGPHDDLSWLATGYYTQWSSFQKLVWHRLHDTPWTETLRFSLGRFVNGIYNDKLNVIQSANLPPGVFQRGSYVVLAHGNKDISVLRSDVNDLASHYVGQARTPDLRQRMFNRARSLDVPAWADPVLYRIGLVEVAYLLGLQDSIRFAQIRREVNRCDLEQYNDLLKGIVIEEDYSARSYWRRIKDYFDSHPSLFPRLLFLLLSCLLCYLLLSVVGRLSWKTVQVNDGRGNFGYQSSFDYSNSDNSYQSHNIYHYSEGTGARRSLH